MKRKLLLKRLLFILLAPLYVTLSFLAYQSMDYWTDLVAKKPTLLKVIFFFLLIPIYTPPLLFLYLTYGWWTHLNDIKAMDMVVGGIMMAIVSTG